MPTSSRGFQKAALQRLTTAKFLLHNRYNLDRAAAEAVRANLVGIAAPVLGELALRTEGNPQRDQNTLRLRKVEELGLAK